ncbi:MAG: AbrB/MazE/SpoVT family DNA-binding domain-containing protein [Thermoproteales archaeon]|nr:AbrB/MazE/SpoVT family DNA-binding domain-containing protein [Thermoproteales archaeon]
MPTVKITRKYQVTIPKEIREKLNLRVGDLLRVEVEGDKIILKPVIKPRENPVEEMLNLVREPLDVDAVKLVEESWEDD